MQKISNSGLEDLKVHVKNPLENLWKKLEKADISKDCIEEYNFIYKFLDKVEYEWERVGE